MAAQAMDAVEPLTRGPGIRDGRGWRRFRDCRIAGGEAPTDRQRRDACRASHHFFPCEIRQMRPFCESETYNDPSGPTARPTGRYIALRGLLSFISPANPSANTS